jgi:hypothetical protein
MNSPPTARTRNRYQLPPFDITKSLLLRTERGKVDDMRRFVLRKERFGRRGVAMTVDVRVRAVRNRWTEG